MLQQRLPQMRPLMLLQKPPQMHQQVLLQMHLQRLLQMHQQTLLQMHQQIHPRTPRHRLQQNPQNRALATSASLHGKKPGRIAKVASLRNSCAELKFSMSSPNVGSKNASSPQKHVQQSHYPTLTTFGIARKMTATSAEDNTVGIFEFFY